MAMNLGGRMRGEHHPVLFGELSYAQRFSEPGASHTVGRRPIRWRMGSFANTRFSLSASLRVQEPVMARSRSRLTAEIDFDSRWQTAAGLSGCPYSVHRSAYGWIPIPVACSQERRRPAVLLMAGNHGDEYEGQVALGKLIRSLEAEEVCGRIIILPSANFPAAMAGTRTSPLELPGGQAPTVGPRATTPGHLASPQQTHRMLTVKTGHRRELVQNPNRAQPGHLAHTVLLSLPPTRHAPPC